MASLAGRHALVTGAGSGIGAAIAIALASEGAHLTLAGRRRSALEETAARIGSGNIVCADITSEAECGRMLDRARDANGPVDIVIANAGAAESAPASRIDIGHWKRMIDVNLTGTFLTVRSALPDLMREGGGNPLRRVVMVASTAGLKGYPYVAAYCAAKHGVVGLTKALAAELAPRGITVNAVCPGFTETPLLEASVANIVAKTGRSAEEARRSLSAGNPQGRFIKPEEVAATVAWLCQPSSAAITGQAISVSGGET